MLAVFGHSFCLPSDGRAFQQSQVYAFPLPPAALNKCSQEGLEEQCCHLGTPESSERGVFCSLGGSDFCWVCWLGSPGSRADFGDGLFWPGFCFPTKSLSLVAQPEPPSSCLEKAGTAPPPQAPAAHSPLQLLLKSDFSCLSIEVFSADKNWRRICCSCPDRKINTGANDF